MRSSARYSATTATACALFVVAACTALAIALDHGIQLNRENHAGMLPVVRSLLDPGYLPGDFGISIRAHHHRVFAWIVAQLSSTGLGITGALAVLTVTGYAVIFLALWRLGAALGLAAGRRLLLGVALATGFAFLDHGVEANRFLGNGPIMPPTFAHAFILFSIDALVRKRWTLAFVFAGAVALVHLQIGAIWGLVLAIEATRQGVWRTPRAWLPGLALAALVASPALLDLLALTRQGLTQDIAAMGDVAFRMPQHFQFHGNRFAAVALYLAVLAWLWRRWRARGDARADGFAPLLWIATTIMALTALHYLDYYLLGTGWIARIQLLRLSVFVPVLGAFAILSQAPPVASTERAPRERWPWVIAGVFAIAALGTLYAKGEPPSLRLQDYAAARNDWAELCRWVRRQGPAGLYVTPPGQTGFTAWSERSTLVEFKINPDGGAGLAEWQRRLRAVSGGTLPQGSRRNDVAAALDLAYATLPESGFAALARDYGVRYAVVPVDNVVRGRELHRNATYRVVELAD